MQALSSSGPFIAYLQQLQSLSALLSTLPASSDSTPAGAGGFRASASTTSGAEFLSSLLQLISPSAGSSGPSASFSSSAPLNPAQFLTLLRAQSSGGKFRGFNQEDAHELWNVLQDIVERHAAQIVGQWGDAVRREKNAARERREAMDLEALMEGEAGAQPAAGEAAAAASAVSPTDSDSPSSNAATAGAAAAAAEGEVLIPSKKPASDGHLSNGTHFDPPSDTDSEPASEMHSSSSASELHSSIETSSIQGANGHDANGAAAGASADAAASSMPSWATQSFAHGSNSSSSSIGAAFAARLAAQAALARSDPLSGPIDPFQGLRANFLVCKSCHTPSSSRVKTEPFNSLTLSFPYGDSSPTDLYSLLSLFVKTELVESVRCEKCNWSERHRMLREEYARLLHESRVTGTKPGPKARRYQELLSQLIAEAAHAEMLLQPNAGQLVEQWARDQAQAQAAAAATARKKESQAREEEEKKGSSASASSSSAAGAAAPSASSLSASDSFLSSAAAPPVACSVSGPSLWSTLPALVRDPEFARSIPSVQKGAALNFLVRLSSLDTKRTFAKSTTLSRLPRMLCLHLNRLDGFSFNGKRSQHVEFPARLDMSRYTTAEKADALVTNIALSSDPGSANARKFNKQKAAKIAGLSGAAAAAGSAPPGSLYQLDAVVVHLGGGSGGHYVAYRRQAQAASAAAAAASSWYYVSDEECRPVSFQTVLQAQAYLLIYSAIE